jgi:organic hydroperoxide reductase OsmC/OhrA
MDAGELHRAEMKKHTYAVKVTWTGNEGPGTQSYSSYRRDHTIQAAGKAEIQGSSDPKFRGDPHRYNPEELLVASLSSCHMLWYLHLCAVNHITVLEYRDDALGEMEERPDGSGAFVRVQLRPRIKIANGNNPDHAAKLHADAHRFCFIANSVNFPVTITPEINQ